MQFPSSPSLLQPRFNRLHPRPLLFAAEFLERFRDRRLQNPNLSNFYPDQQLEINQSCFLSP